MKKIKYFLISSVLLFIALNSCKKIEHSNEVPLVLTGDTSNIKLTSAIITGTATPNDAPIQTSGHVWSSINQLPTYSANEAKTTTNGLLPQNKIISNLTNLSPGKIYYVRGYVISGADTIYGNVINFFTLSYQPTNIITDTVSNITFTSANVAATVTSIGNTPITQHGHVWSSTNNTPTIADSLTSLGPLSVPATYTSSLSNLSAGTIYYARAYAVNTGGTVYGNVVSFTTLSNTVPSVTTDSVINISINSATAKGNITNIGSSPVTQYGHVWSSVNNVPTINDSKTQLGTANAAIIFGSQLTALTANTTYYVRSYAINATGITYGAVLTFKTGAAANNPPVVTTGNFSAVTTNTETVAGSITDIGSSTVTQYGHVWSSVNNVPTINDSKSQLGTANAATNFNSQLTGLTASTTYYVRAYATNNGGITYGQVITFVTASSGNTLPVVTTGNISSVTFSTANADGNITDVGSSPVTQYGHVWSDIHPNPILGDYQSNLGTTNLTKGFNTALTGLQPGNQYWVRAYSTNASGTSYGDVVSFRTFVTVATFPVASITANSANAIGIFNSGNQPSASVTSYGHVWSSTNTVPTINDSKTQFGPAGGGLIGYGSPLTGLTNNTKYYVRAYAINSAGIVYGDIVTFTTGTNSNYPPSVKTGLITSISATTAFGQGDITDIGSATVTNYGHVWSSTNISPTIVDNKTDLGSATGAISFTSPLTALLPSTTYYIRGYAQNSFGITYGVVVVITTTAYTFADVTTGDPYYQPPGVANSIVVFPGTINSAGNTPITEHGHVWSKTNTTPTLADNFNQLGAASAGAYNSVFSPTVITPGTYYVRAYATNSAGTIYGAVKTFTY